jgi:hypothetical protein
MAGDRMSGEPAATGPRQQPTSIHASQKESSRAAHGVAEQIDAVLVDVKLFADDVEHVPAATG